MFQQYYMKLTRKKKLEKWCKITSCHGIMDCYESQTTSGKSFWTFIILGSLGVAIWQVHELFSDFISEPHYRTTTYSRDVGKVEFPNVVLCNFNRAHRDKVMALGMTMENDSSNLDPDYLNYFYKAFPTSYLLSAKHDYKLLGHKTAKRKFKHWKRKFEAWQVRQNLTNLTPLDLLHVIALQCHEMVFECFLELQEERDCCKNTEAIVTVYGLCWSLNQPRFAYGSGQTNAFNLLMVPRVNSYTPEVVESNYLEEGLILGISFNPYHFKVKNPVILRPGTSTKVSMKSLVELRPKPKYEIFTRNCVQNGTLAILKGPYSQEYCYDDCGWIHVNTTCDCAPLAAVRPTDVLYCDPYQQMTCGVSAAFELEDLESEQYEYGSCIRKCKPPCEGEQRVEVGVVTGKFPGPSFLAGMRQRYADLSQFWLGDHIEEFIHVEIFFSSMSQLVTEEIEKVPIFNLIGSFGGQLGLWLGISILTMVQALVYLASCSVYRKQQ